MYGAAASGEGWPDRVAEKLAVIAMLVRAYRRQDELPEGLRADVRAQIGWTQREDDVLAGPGVSDVWQVLGVRVEEDERYRSMRTWLVGKESKRWAVVLSFAAAQAPLDAVENAAELGPGRYRFTVPGLEAGTWKVTLSLSDAGSGVYELDVSR